MRILEVGSVILEGEMVELIDSEIITEKNGMTYCDILKNQQS